MEDGADKANITDNAREQRFSAFISYSHADAAAVRKLHSQIESYRLPKGLGSIDALNGRKGKVGKIFRDREDLSAAEDLSVAVKDALGRSEVLVVACSPDAKASQWVDQEITYFRGRHPDRPILAAILRGEPSEAFPAALTEGGIEPLAADLRKHGDGWRLGFLKVIAGIVGVPLDALVQRDSQRQLRRVMAVTGLVAVIAIAMSVMTTIALQARNEAQTLRASSDAFIDELLTDGREDLIAVGRLDILDKFNERALRFYTSQGDVERLPADSLQNWATILHAMGEDETKKEGRDLGKALEYFQAAHDATEELLRREPNNPDRIFGHAQSVYWVGRIAEIEEDFHAAKQRYLRYRDLADQLAIMEPDSRRGAMERGFASSNLGIVAYYSNAGNREARDHFLRASTRFTEANRKWPSDVSISKELLNSYSWVSDTYYSEERFSEALQWRLKSEAIARGILDEDPDNFELRFDLLIQQRVIAVIKIQIGELDEAREQLQIARLGMLKLLDQDLTNIEWQDFYMKICGDFAKIEDEEGREKCLLR